MKFQIKHQSYLLLQNLQLYVINLVEKQKEKEEDGIEDSMFQKVTVINVKKLEKDEIYIFNHTSINSIEYFTFNMLYIY